MPYTDEGQPYAPQSDTSKRAAEAVRPRAPTQRARIIAQLNAIGHEGATCEELVNALKMTASSVRPRLRELEEDRQIYKLLETRPTRRRQDAHVYVLLEHARGRAFIPFTPYVLLPRPLFDEAFDDYDAEWRNARWGMLEKHVSDQKEKRGE